MGSGRGEGRSLYALILLLKEKTQEKSGLVCFSSINLRFMASGKGKMFPSCGKQAMLLFPPQIQAYQGGCGPSLASWTIFTVQGLPLPAVQGGTGGVDAWTCSLASDPSRCPFPFS